MKQKEKTIKGLEEAITFYKRVGEVVGIVGVLLLCAALIVCLVAVSDAEPALWGVFVLCLVLGIAFIIGGMCLEHKTAIHNYYLYQVIGDVETK